MDRNIPHRIRSQYTDRLVSFFRYVGDMMIQLEMEFAQQLDTERLAKAVNLTLDAEPVLGCRFVLRWWRPYWERLDESEREAFLLARDGGEYEAFKASSIDVCSGPQVKACLWHSPAGDRLLIKVAHEAADAGGVKEIAAAISSIYSRLADEPDYRPEPNLRGSRSLWQIMRHVPWYAYPRIYLNFLREYWASMMLPITHTLSIEDGRRAPLTFIYRHLPIEGVSRLAQYGRTQNATLNDVVLAAFFRALVNLGKGGRAQLRLNTTVDFRRYLPGGRGEGICNLSATEAICLDNGLGDDFNSTLTRISTITKHRKASWIGLNDYVGLVPFHSALPYALLKILLRKVMQLGLEKQNTPNELTNMGLISTESVTFKAKPVNAYLLPPPLYPPMFLAGLSGYAETLTLSASVYPSQKDITERFFDAVLAELPV